MRTAIPNGDADDEVDVLIVGGGPTGAAAAITLADAGVRALLVERTPGTERSMGEVLPPAAKPILAELGLGDEFVQDGLRNDGHLVAFGVQSAWGASTLHTHDYQFDPHGTGWLLDRSRFDGVLRAQAGNAGAWVWLDTKLVGVWRETGGWIVELSSRGRPHRVRSRWLLDCSGRAHVVARQLGVARLYQDRLIAQALLFCELESDAPQDVDGMTVIETVEAGWWYTCRQPGGKRIVVYLSDADLPTTKVARSVPGFLDLIEETRYIRQRVGAASYVACGVPFAGAANSGRLAQFAGEGWLAAGDAARSFDPIAGQGLFHALYSGMKAAEAVLSVMQYGHHGEQGAVAAYGNELAQVYDIYRRRQRQVYGVERRWPQSKFWRRRYGACEG